jgi:hypothetical protein
VEQGGSRSRSWQRALGQLGNVRRSGEGRCWSRAAMEGAGGQELGPTGGAMAVHATTEASSRRRLEQGGRRCGGR